MRKNSFQKFLKAYPIIWIPILYVGYLLYKKIKAGVSGLGDTVKNNVVANVIDSAMKDHGIVEVRAAYIVKCADDIYNAFYKDSMWGMGEDEVKAMSAFNSMVSVDEAIVLAVVYRAAYNKGLRTDIDQYCHNTDFDSLRTSFYNAIQNV